MAKILIKFKPVKEVVSFLMGVRLELSKVTWPKKNEVVKLTLIVFSISAILGIYVGLLDLVFTKLLELLISF